jgi:hypothetical protein
MGGRESLVHGWPEDVFSVKFIESEKRRMSGSTETLATQGGTPGLPRRVECQVT